MNGLIIGTVIGAALVAALIALICWGNYLRRKADETVTIVNGQVPTGITDAYTRKADQLSRWIRVLGAIVIVYVLALLVYWLR